ncbi:molybdopterin converting factor, small subunit [Candidatus Planktophila limnetica]|uniref:Molybdopterin converting factor, small subunit n=1 Tax=Candidatus Planktophila limnetica TaxID=573600 RepID=A0A249LGM4_9ACTN|nr:MoaD/ThiS family protein [Candidatus Planktophila limnetica]ASY28084.1 molybdopterin converting factor, small subunit [Candidatus Planktophila limnetica]
MAIVNFYAAARAASGVSESQIDGSTLGEVIASASAQHPQLVAILPGCSFLVNGAAESNNDLKVGAGDVIDILPRFAGGA